MKRLLLFAFICILGRLSAQVTFVADSIPAYTPPADYLYIAGDFNGWDPGDIHYRLAKNEDQNWQVTLPARQEGTQIQFKFTRGSWATVEKGPNGEEIANRTFTYGNGQTVHVIIYNWSGGGGTGSTAAENVIIMSEDFAMPQLDRTRRIWIYLPPYYESSGLDYPVLYMQDGQNLFDDSTSFAGEWHVDETLNDLCDEGYKVPIVVGIDHGGEDRQNEYTPWAHPQYGGGDGDLYMEFVVENLKPYVDAHYRTIPGREGTGIMGSSLGGLISHFGALKYQEVISKAGIFSPSYWFSDSVWQFTREAGRQDAMRMYLMCGGAEGQGTINNVLDMRDTLLASGFSADEVTTTIIPGGEHNEALWSSDFGDAYLWLFASFASQVPEPARREIITLYPNPAENFIELPSDFPGQYDSLQLVNMEGQVVFISVPFNGKQLDISPIPSGIYLLTAFIGNTYYEGKVVKR